MSRTIATFEAADWPATDPRNAKSVRGRTATDTVYRVLNDTDVPVSVSVFVTHHEDTAFEYAVETTSFTVAPDSFNGTLLTEPWERVSLSVTPESAPSEGAVSIIGMGGL